MSNLSSLASSLNTHHADPALIAQVCVGLVRSWAGGKDLDDMYRDLLQWETRLGLVADTVVSG